jgi:hypothetical protein
MEKASHERVPADCWRYAWMLLLGLAAACAQTHGSPELGTNTNWLKPCATDSECSGGTSCLCGVCTLACDRDNQCGALNERTQCNPLSALACGDGMTAPSACVQECSSNAECTSLERGLCVDGLCIPAPTQVSGGAAVTEHELARREANVLITETYTECSDDADCKLVGTSCNGCCQLGAIQTSLEATYESNRQLACADYEGAICDCDYGNVAALCEQGRCRTLQQQETSCYSPWQNADRAGLPDALGCPCSEHALVGCAGQTTFYCLERSGFPGGRKFWWAMATAECGTIIYDQDCSKGREFDTGPACISEYVQCYDLPNGRWCGVVEHFDPSSF